MYRMISMQSRSERRGPLKTMPSQTMDSSSFFSQALSFHDERQLGIWKSEEKNKYGAKADEAISPYMMANGLEHMDSVSKIYQRGITCQETFEPGLENASDLLLPRGLEQNFDSASTDVDKAKFSMALNENARFSSTLPELCSQRYAEDHHEEKETFESLQELEAKTIGNLLPDDDDLFYGVADAIDWKKCHIGKDGMVDDRFSSVGGSEFWEDGQTKPEALKESLNNSLRRSNNTTDLNFPLCGYRSRTLLIQNINSNIQDSELQALFGQYGDISSLNTTCKHRGFVMISYYDIRAASNAMEDLQNKLVQHGKLDIHFSFAKENPSDKDVNPGTIVVPIINLSVSSDELRQIFGVYGDVKEIREIPQSSHYKLIEFYDVRAADAAFHALHRSGIVENKINGSVMSARFSGRPPLTPNLENAFRNGISSRAPIRSPSPKLDSVGNHSNSMEGSNPHGQLKFDIWGTKDFLFHSLPDYQDSSANGSFCNSPGNKAVGRVTRPSELVDNQFGRVSPRGHLMEWNETGFSASPNGNSLSPGQHTMWNSSPRPQPQGMMWSNSPSFVNGICSPRPQQMNGIDRPPCHLHSGLMQMNNHSMGSAPSVNLSLWERRNGVAGESQDTSAFNLGSLGGLSVPGNSPHVVEFPNNMFPNGGNSMDNLHSPNVQMHCQNQRFMMVSPRGQLSPLPSPFESPNERTRGRRNEGSSNQGDKRQFELDIDRIMHGEDKRTTLMIKNIPNKYTSKMLISAIDEHHKGTYDFLYLPIDFKNKCNVGYSFINMTDPSLIVPLYQAFNGKKWEKFNSEKVASIAYARIQGKAALIAHFQNSSLMNEDKRCRPMLFNSDGPNAGDQVPFPTGANIRSRPRIKSSRSLESVEECLPDPTNEEELLGTSSETSSGRDSD